MSANSHVKDKRISESETIYQMIRLYCRKKHNHKKDLCPECEELFQYAKQRIDVCPFMETKTFCSNCKVHCYKRDMRERVRDVMRFSGPRMLLHRPIMVIRHLYYDRKEKKL